MLPVLFETYLQIVFVMRVERNEDGHLPGNSGLKIPGSCARTARLSKACPVLSLRDFWLQISEFCPVNVLNGLDWRRFDENFLLFFLLTGSSVVETD